MLRHCYSFDPDLYRHQRLPASGKSPSRIRPPWNGLQSECLERREITSRAPSKRGARRLSRRAEVHSQNTAVKMDCFVPGAFWARGQGVDTHKGVLRPLGNTVHFWYLKFRRDFAQTDNREAHVAKEI